LTAVSQGLVPWKKYIANKIDRIVPIMHPS
jgi:hypothetical protein